MLRLNRGITPPCSAITNNSNTTNVKVKPAGILTIYVADFYSNTTNVKVKRGFGVRNMIVWNNSNTTNVKVKLALKDWERPSLM